LLLFDATALSRTGPRADNQDSVLVGSHLVAVADGVGGNVGGAVASSLIANWLAPLACPADAIKPDGTALREVITQANARIADAVRVRPRLRTMATTLVAVLACSSGLVLAYIGDSRVYRLRDAKLTQLTKDQTLVQSLMDEGVLTAEQAAVHPQRSVVWAALHGDPDNIADLQLQDLGAQPGDRFLLCSDGLSDVLRPTHMEWLLARAETPAAAAEELVAAALGAPATDNISVVVADAVDEEGVLTRAPSVLGAAAQAHEAVAEALEALWPLGAGST
jgi:protein phosphatase